MNINAQQIEIQEQPFPRKQFKRFAVGVSFLLMITASLLSFLISELTNIQAAYESLNISFIAMLFLMFRKYHQENYSIILHSSWLHPLCHTILFFRIGTLFKIKGYSLAISLAATIFALTQSISIYSAYKIERKFSKNTIILMVMALYIGVCYLVKQKFLAISWRILAVAPALFIILSAINGSIQLVNLYKNQQQQNWFVYRYSRLRYPVGTLIIGISIIDLLVIISKAYLSSPSFFNFAVPQFFISLIVFIVFYALDQKIFLFCVFPKFSKQQTLFRVHYRCYNQEYDSQTCQRYCQWRYEDCLLCTQKASIVNKCGHLTLCLTCKDKLSKKQYISCLLCGQQSRNYRVLNLSTKRVMMSYKGAIFIQKPLYLNQVRTL